MNNSRVTKDKVDKHIDEARLDSDRRAKDTMDYEQMLMAYIESELRGDIH